VTETPGHAEASQHISALPGRIPHARVVAKEALEAVGDAAPAAGDVARTVSADASGEFTAVADRVAGLMGTIGVPGAALGILADGREEHATFGVASIDGGTPVTAETRFQIGSLTKTFTATAIMRLAEQGRIELDAPVRAYLPGLTLADRLTAERVAIRHLLTHTAGWWGDAFMDTGDGDDAIAHFTDGLLPTFPQLSPLGKFYSYNNAGFVLLGRVLEVVCGLSYRRALRELVLEPLSLEQSTFVPAAGVPHAEGHCNGEEGLSVQSPLFLPRNVDPAGGLWSTTADLLRYACLHLGDGGSGAEQLLDRQTREAMQSPQLEIPGRLPGGPGMSGGMNWMLQDIAGIRFAHHDGDTFGQHTEFVIAAERKFAFVLLTNSEPGGKLLAAAALSEALSRYLGLGADAGRVGVLGALAPADAPTVELEPDQLREYVGVYREPNASISVEAGEDGLRLTVELTALAGQVQPKLAPAIPRDLPLSFAGRDLARVAQTLVPFLRGPDHRVGWASFGLRVLARE
jgi:CubicO group peptidase (beta-lactamase class C family)